MYLRKKGTVTIVFRVMAKPGQTVTTIFNQLYNWMFLYNDPEMSKYDLKFCTKTGPEVIKLFMLEHEILNAHNYKNIKKFSFFRLR